MISTFIYHLYCGKGLQQNEFLFNPPQLDQHGQVQRRLPLGLGQPEIGVGVALPLRNPQPDYGQVVGKPGRLCLPGTLLAYLTSLEDPQQQWIIPALDRRRNGPLKGVIETVIVELVLSLGQLVSPCLPFRGRQITAITGERGWGTGCLANRIKGRSVQNESQL